MDPQEIKNIYADLRDAAVEIASRYPVPDFYVDLADSIAFSRRGFEENPFLKELLASLEEVACRNLGHDLVHARLVALDAGTIAAAEADFANFSANRKSRMVFLAHCAGLLHDVKRAEPDHAEKGSQFAASRLRQAGLFKEGEIEIVAFAIRNHEAFKQNCVPDSLECHIVSGSLYDADKFRWGPDNFTRTVWKMLEEVPLSLSRFAAGYPGAMSHIEKIKSTFRTATGKAYGPQFIDIGIAIGRELMGVATKRYGHLF